MEKEGVRENNWGGGKKEDRKKSKARRKSDPRWGGGVKKKRLNFAKGVNGVRREGGGGSVQKKVKLRKTRAEERGGSKGEGQTFPWGKMVEGP